MKTISLTQLATFGISDRSIGWFFRKNGVEALITYQNIRGIVIDRHDDLKFEELLVSLLPEKARVKYQNQRENLIQITDAISKNTVNELGRNLAKLDKELKEFDLKRDAVILCESSVYNKACEEYKDAYERISPIMQSLRQEYNDNILKIEREYYENRMKTLIDIFNSSPERS